MSNKAEVAFARKISSISSQWAGVLAPEMTGADHELLLIVDTNKPAGDANVAIFNFKDGDRSGRPIWKGCWRLNQNPTGNAPSFWIDGDILSLSVWCQPDYWTVQRSVEAVSTVREYEF